MSDSNAAIRDDIQYLQGIWRTVAVEVDGSPVASSMFENARLVIAGDSFTLRNPLPDADQRTEGSIRLDAEKVPKELHLILDDGTQIDEIYELNENRLRICYPIKGGKRPTEFQTFPQSGLSLVLYEREGRL